MFRVQIDGPGGPRGYTLDTDSVTLGRAPGNTIVLAENGVSRQHARLEQQGGAVTIVDLNSSNGTSVGARLLRGESAVLAVGDVARIGPFVLRLLDVVTAGPAPLLTVRTASGVYSVPLDRDEAIIGRDPNSDVCVDVGTVSQRHALVRRVGGGWQLADLQSRNGVRLNGQLVDTAPLVDGAVFQLAPDVSVTFSLAVTILPEQNGATPPAVQPTAPPLRHGDAARPLGTIHPTTATRVTVGRDPSNDLTLDSPQVSRHHAVFERGAPDLPWTVTDLNSTNHTFVNGAAVGRQQLAEGDVVRIGPHRLTVHGGSLHQDDETQGFLIEALDLTTVVAGKKRILDNVSFVARPAEFVAIVGGSGAGKTTLVGALSGLRPATQGQVLLNGFPLYAHFDAFRAQIGYVPQDDIIHRELSAGHALEYAAQLRMPTDTSPRERRARVDEVLDTLGLAQHRNTQIGRMSGGQRKRVSIGVELLTSPPLFFLDEPTSGLDPGAETRMMELLRKLADGGRTVILITHATRNIALCDKVCFMAEGGRLAFFGAPAEALSYFHVNAFEDIYQQVEDTRSAQDWQQDYRGSRHCDDQITGPLAYRRTGTLPPLALPTAIKQPPAAEALRQFGILSKRYAEIVLNDRKNLLVLLAQAPIIAVLLWLLLPNPFATGTSDNYVATQAAQLASILALTAVWLGSLNAIREISKEDAIYRRERRVNLSVIAYVCSKLAVLFVLVVAQATLLVGITAANIHFPSSGGIIATWITLVLTGAASVAIALAISAAVSNPDRAVFIAPIVLLPQIFFCGLVKPVDQLGRAAQPLAAIVPARWGFEAIGRVTDVVSLAANPQGFPETSALSGDWFSRWLILLVFVVAFTPLAIGLQRLKDRR
jgi:ABC transport system ATP-binding/permease protein